MSRKSQKIHLQPHLWGHLDGMASGMGTSPEALLERAVTMLLHLHGYEIARPPAQHASAPGPADATPPRPNPFQMVSVRLPPQSPPEAPALGAKTPTIATRVEGVDKKPMPIITGVVSGFQPTIQAKHQGGIPELKSNLPSTANLRPPKGEPPEPPPSSGPGLGDDDDRHFATQISMAHRPPEDMGHEPFPTNPTDDTEAPFVSDVIAVPPELWANDSKVIVAPVVSSPRTASGTHEAIEAMVRDVEEALSREHAVEEDLEAEELASPEEFSGATTDAVPAALVQAMIQSGKSPTHQPPEPAAPPVHVESFTAPRSDLTPAHESFTAPRSDLNPAHESFTAPQSELNPADALSQTHGLGPEATQGEAEQTQVPSEVPSEVTHLSSAEATHGLSEETHVSSPGVTVELSEEAHLSSAEATHGLSEETHVSSPGVTVGLSEETHAPISELTPTAEGLQRPEAETRGMDVPWETGPAEASIPERGELLPSPVVEPVPEPLPPPLFESAPEPPPPPLAPPLDADPSRLAAAARIRAIAADLEKWVLPREDRPFSVDVAPSEKK
jgi:hypothetical protein